MVPVVRVLVVAFVRFAFVFFAGWFAFNEDALGVGAPLVSRLAFVLLFLVVSILLGEIDRLRTHFGLLIGALRAAGGGQGGGVDAAAQAASTALGGDAPPAADPKASIEILIRALGAADAGTRENARHHLQRLTGKNLPADAALWARWWQENRGAYEAPPDTGRGPPGNSTGDPA